MPFVDSTADVVLQVFATIVLVGTVTTLAIIFWKLHEMPLEKAHKEKHHQLGLITVLTWIGFVWHWVWVLAVIIAFVDMEKAILRLRDIWQSSPSLLSQNEGDK